MYEFAWFSVRQTLKLYGRFKHSKSVNWDNIRKYVSQRHFDDKTLPHKSSLMFYSKTYIHSTYSIPKRRTFITVNLFVTTAVCDI